MNRSMVGRLAGYVALMLASGVAPSLAATVTVDCGAGDDLQAAITAAPSGTTLDVSGTCAGVFTVGKHLTLRGRPMATLDAQGQGTTLTITRGGVRVSWMTITGGNDVRDNTRGGILSDGNLTLNHVTVTGNQARAVGGIQNGFGTLTLDHSKVTQNTSTIASIGGIYNQCGTVILRNSTVSDNAGTGIFNDRLCGTESVTIADSTISGNVSSVQAGGIDNRVAMTVVRSTVANNAGHAGQKPGGIANSGTLTVMFSTISGNIGLGDSGGIDDAPGHPATITASIIAGNATTTGSAYAWDCAGPLISNGYNLIGTTNQPSIYPSHPCSYTADATDQAGGQTPIKPRLLPLAAHGGSTQTMPPRATSPAVDAIPLDALALDGTTRLCPASGSTDQRGRPRPNGPACDVGSVEK